MKQRHYITTVSLIMVLTGLSSVMADDAGITRNVPITPMAPQMHGNGASSTPRMILTPQQLDHVNAGLMSVGEIWQTLHEWGGAIYDIVQSQTNCNSQSCVTF